MKDLTAAFEALKEKQQASADRLSLQAIVTAGRPLSAATVTAAVTIVAAVARDRGRGGIAEPAADLRDVRADPIFSGGLLRDLRTAENQASLLIVGALTLAYISQVEGTPLNGARLTYTADAQSRAALAAYPILGETGAEHAAAITEALRRDTLRAVGLPLTGQADGTRVAEALGLAAEQHAARVGAAVSEAYFAGVQAGVIDASRALTGAA